MPGRRTAGGRGGKYVAARFTADVVGEQIRDPRSTVLLAGDDVGVAGYAHIRIAEPPPGVVATEPLELVRYLAQDRIGCGYGARLMLAIHDEARRRARRTICLRVYDRNERAIAFYRKFGFVVAGQREFILAGRVYLDPVMVAPVAAKIDATRSAATATPAPITGADRCDRRDRRDREVESRADQPHGADSAYFPPLQRFG